ncbi:MAG: peptidase E [Myxococcales bacterium]|nr:peptidase E [Myxococcales bacterium]
MTENRPKEPTIFAIGGGGFSPLLDGYSLNLTGKADPKVCFLPTASGDAEGYIENFYAAFRPLGAQCSHLSLTRYNQPDPIAHLLDQDLIYVGGGNAFQMLLVWRAHGIDKALRQAWNQGTVLTGLSAGSICWFSGATTDSWGLPLSVLNDGLGFLPGSHSPHYDSEAERRVTYEHNIAAGALPDGLAIDDHCGVLFRGTQRIESVCSVAGKGSYLVTREGERAKETPLPTRCLGPES